MRNAFFLIILLLFTGCGHNIGTTSKGIGLNVSWTSGSYLPNMALGYWDINQAVVRGNAVYTVNTSTGGSAALIGGTSQSMELKAGTQFNEGNLKEVLANPLVDKDVKIAVAEKVNTTTYPEPTSFSVRTSSAAAASGTTLLEVKPVTSGLDKIVETVGEVASTAVQTVPSAVVTASENVKTSTDTVKDTVDKFEDILGKIKNIAKKYINIALLLLIWITVLYIAYRFRKKKKVLSSKNKN